MPQHLAAYTVEITRVEFLPPKNVCGKSFRRRYGTVRYDTTGKCSTYGSVYRTALHSSHFNSNGNFYALMEFSDSESPFVALF